MDISKWEFDFENNRGSKQVHSYVLTKPSYKPKIKLSFRKLKLKVHTWEPVSTDCNGCWVRVFQNLIHLSAVPPPDASKPCYFMCSNIVCKLYLKMGILIFEHDLMGWPSNSFDSSHVIRICLKWSCSFAFVPYNKFVIISPWC